MAGVRAWLRCASRGVLYRVSVLPFLDVHAVVHTLGERRTHDHTAHAGGGLEVSLAALSPAGVEGGVDLRHCAGPGRRRWVGGAVVSCRRRRPSSSGGSLNFALLWTLALVRAVLAPAARLVPHVTRSRWPARRLLHHCRGRRVWTCCSAGKISAASVKGRDHHRDTNDTSCFSPRAILRLRPRPSHALDSQRSTISTSSAVAVTTDRERARNGAIQL